jgi:hypothetical protein
MSIRRRKTRARRVTDALTGYLKGARKSVRSSSAYKAVRDTPVARRGLPIVAGVGVAAVAAAKLLRGGREDRSAAPA